MGKLKNKVLATKTVYRAGSCRQVALIEQKGAVEPYIIAFGYDEKEGDWRYGHYYKSKKVALGKFAEVSKY